MTSRPDLVPSTVGFVRALRAAGIGASHDRLHAFVEALGVLDVARRRDVYWAGRATLCAGPDDIVRYDRVFRAYFDGAPPPRPRTSRPIVRLTSGSGRAAAPDAPTDTGAAPIVATNASRVERLRHRDVATLTAQERAELHRILAALSLPGEARPSRRHRPARRGTIDRSRTVRRLLAAGGEPARLAHRRHRVRPRRVVLLVDVSGSMAGYADVLLRFAHATVRGHRGRTEVFTLGTRLTRVTVPMGLRDPDVAMRGVAAAVPDWGGGTRLGETLKRFLDEWGQRGTARGAVAVILSDGWERDDPVQLGRQVERLSRLAHRVVWANPRAGREGFAPTASGMAAALPHVDDLVAGHSLAALERLARVVIGAARVQAVPESGISV